MAEDFGELGSMYVKIQADQSKLEAEMRALKRKLDTESKTPVTFKAKFDSAIAKLRIDELLKLQKKLQAEFDKKIKLNVDAASLDRTRQKIASVQSALSGVNKEAGPTTGLLKEIGSGVVAAFGTAAIVKFGFEAVTLAGKVQGVKAAFDNLNQPGLLNRLREATRGTVSDFQLMQVTMRAANFKIPLSELATYLEFAKKRATQTGQEVDYLVDSIIDGIGRKSALVLDNLGISASELQAEFAKTGDFGKAVANIIAREMGKMGDVVETSADKLAQLNAEIENQKVKIGNDLLPYWNATLFLFGKIIDSIGLIKTGLFQMVGINLPLQEKLLEMAERHQTYGKLLVQTYKENQKISAFIVSTYKQQLDTVGRVKEKIDELAASQDGMIYGSEKYLKTQKEIERLEKSIGLGDKNNKVTTEFVSKIPKGYTADQVAEFEKLKFAILGYVEFRKAQIEDVYKNEIEKAKGNAIEIAKAEENKILSIANLNRDLAEFKKEAQEKEIADTELFFKEIDQLSKENQEKIKQQENQYYLNRLTAIDSFYSNVKSKSEDYFKYQLEKLKEQSEELLNATGDPLLAKQLEIEGLKALEQEYFEWKIEQWKNQAGIFAASLSGIEAGYDAFWQSLANADITGAERLQQVWDAIKGGILQAVGEIIKGYITSLIQAQVVGDALKAAELTKGVALGGSLAAAYAPAAAFASIMSFGGAAAAGSAGLVSTVALAKALAIPSFSKGGDFIVPSGYPNDSYPMLVESGERVTVTPSGKSGPGGLSGRDVDRIVNAIRAMNMNLLDKDFSVAVVNSSPDVKTTVRRGEKIKTQLTRQGAKLNER